jgi:hypothetical protein
VIASRAELARRALATARAETAQVIERIAEVEAHLDERTFDPRRAGAALELLRAARAAADASLREAQEQADLTVDAAGAAKEREPEVERRANGFQVPPPPVPSRPAQRVRTASGVAPVQQRKPTS